MEDGPVQTVRESTGDPVSGVGRATKAADTGPRPMRSAAWPPAAPPLGLWRLSGDVKLGHGGDFPAA